MGMILLHNVLVYCCCCLVAKSCLTLLQPHGLYIAHQAPLSKGFPRQESWSDWSELSFFLQVIFLIQGSNLCLMHWQKGSLSLNHQESTDNINAGKYVFRQEIKSSELERIKVINCSYSKLKISTNQKTLLRCECVSYRMGKKLFL